MGKTIEFYQRGLRRDLVLDSGKIDGVSYVIKTIGGHYPTAYISAHYTERLEEEAAARGIQLITYSTEMYGPLCGLDEDKAWVGWDYGHSSDYICALEKTLDSEGHHYTYEEVMEDVRQMIALAKELNLEDWPLEKSDSTVEIANIKKRLDRLEEKQNDVKEEASPYCNFLEDLTVEDLKLCIQCLKEKIADLNYKRKKANEGFVMLYNINQEIQKHEKLLRKLEDEQSCWKNQSEIIDQQMKKLMDIKRGK